MTKEFKEEAESLTAKLEKKRKEVKKRLKREHKKKLEYVKTKTEGQYKQRMHDLEQEVAQMKDLQNENLNQTGASRLHDLTQILTPDRSGEKILRTPEHRSNIACWNYY